MINNTFTVQLQWIYDVMYHLLIPHSWSKVNTEVTWKVLGIPERGFSLVFIINKVLWNQDFNNYWILYGLIFFDTVPRSCFFRSFSEDKEHWQERFGFNVGRTYTVFIWLGTARQHLAKQNLLSKNNLCVFFSKSFDFGEIVKPLSPHAEGVSYPIWSPFVLFSPSTS